MSETMIRALIGAGGFVLGAVAGWGIPKLLRKRAVAPASTN